jgi:hypothetical protein
MNAHLNNRQRDTVEKIFGHPASGNVEWRQVLSLLEAVATTVEEHNGKVKVTLGPETEVLRVPHGKDIDKQLIVDLRRMLNNAGFGPSHESVQDVRTRDRGDGRWGEPT